MSEDAGQVLILNVNDDPASRYVMSRMLKLAGYAVIEAENGAEALRLASHGPDLVLLDVNLPDINGFEVCRKLRESPTTQRTLVLHTSATYVTSENRAHALTRGADGYITQPFEAEELLATIHALLRQRRAAAADHAVGCVWQSTFDSIGAGLTFLDREGKILSCNVAMSAILGKAAETLIGRPFEKVVEQIFGLTELRPLRDIARVRSRTSTEILLDGRWFLVAADPLFDPDASLRGVVLTWTDTTDRKRLVSELEARQSALLEADARKDEFLAMLAHELRNPLAAITTATHLLEKVADPADRGARFRQTIHRQTRHLSRLVDDLLDVARVTRGNIRIERQSVDLTAVARQAVTSCDELLRSRRHTIEASFPDEPCVVSGDPVRLEQVITNLLSNAIKYTEMGGTIALAIERANIAGGPSFLVRVRDNGVGLTSEEKRHVFELFYQADQSLARSRGGLGIGLTVVQRLVELHGGRVRVESAGRGQGSEFIVTLPADECGVVDPAPQRVAEPLRDSGPMRVLVIEDNPDGAEMGRALLEQWGHEVRVATDGLLGVEIATSWRPDVIMVDVGLPGLDGYEVAQRLRRAEATSHARLLATTGYGRSEDRARALAAGFDAHMVKPLDPAALRAAIAEGPTRPRSEPERGKRAS